MKSEGSANAAVESDDEREAAFFAALEVNELPELLSKYESNTDNGDDGVCNDDGFSEIATNSDSDYEAGESPGTDESNADLLISDDSNYIAMDLEDVHTVFIEVDHTSENIPCIEVHVMKLISIPISTHLHHPHFVSLINPILRPKHPKFATIHIYPLETSTTLSIQVIMMTLDLFLH